MADTVQAVMERMIPELEDLQEKKLFSSDEIHQIVATRREFEYKLRRQPLRKMDGVRYIAYELNLEALRKKRKARLGLQKRSLSDTAGIKRVHAIFDRVLYKHRGSVDLWLQYIAFCKLEESGRVLSHVFTQALQSHPRCAALWIEAASYEFSVNLNVDTARVLMQRAIRINKHDRKLWLEYFRLEMLFVQKLSMRRKILGLDDKVAKPAPVDDETTPVVIDDLPEEEGAQSTDELRKVEVETQQQKTRSMLLEGAIPRVVYQSAIAAIPDDVEFRLDFVAISDLFGPGFAGHISKFIVDTCVEAFPSSELVFSVRAMRPLVTESISEQAERQCATLFEQALGDLPTIVMTEKFAEWIMERLIAPDRTKFIVEYAQKTLKQLVESAGGASADLCAKYIDFLHRTEGTAVALTELQSILAGTNTQSAALWLLCSQLMLYGDANRKTKRTTKRRRTSDQLQEKSGLQRATQVLEDAVAHLAEDDHDGLFQVWERLLEMYMADIDVSPDTIKQGFEAAMQLQTRDSNAWCQLRAHYLLWTASTAPMATVRALYRHFVEDLPLLPTPATRAYLTHCIDIETSVESTSLDIPSIRHLFEKLVDLFGQATEDVWTSYIQFYQREQRFTDANAVLHRALRVWPHSTSLQKAMAGL